MVLEPILESLEISLRLVTPLIKDAKTKGTAISFKRLMNIVPKGLIQWVVNSSQLRTIANKPKATPKIIPKMIFQCSGMCLLNIKVLCFYS